jgi:hypothetical protein
MRNRKLFARGWQTQSMTVIALCLFSFLSPCIALASKSMDSDASDQEEPELPEVTVAPKSGVQAEYPGLLVRPIKISETDPDLASDNREHWTYYQPGVKHIGVLMVGFPGTHNRASSNSGVDALAAQAGYHALSITYRSAIGLAIFRKSSEHGAFQKGRENLLYGSEPIGPLKIDRANSIVNRIVKALQYMQKKYPNEGWGQYLNGDEPVWPKIAVSGLSQGGGHACLLGLEHPVARVLMFGAPKDYSLHFHAPAHWLTMPSKTPKERFFCFVHSGDEGHGCSYKQQVENYHALGLYPHYPIVDVENSQPPYGHTRLLTAHKPADEPKHNHGIVVASPRFKPVWNYMLTEPCP